MPENLNYQDMTRLFILFAFLVAAIVGLVILASRKDARKPAGLSTRFDLSHVVLSALFISLGILIPTIFHLLGGQSLGRMILPMHIPVLIAGFFLMPGYAFLVGAITPFLSSIITGMPPLFPMMYIMVFELSVYGLVVSLLYRWLKRFEGLRSLRLHIILSLVGAMIMGRVIAGLTVWSLVGISGVTDITPFIANPLAYVIGSVSAGSIGIVIQLIVIPAVVIVLEPAVRRSESG